MSPPSLGLKNKPRKKPVFSRYKAEQRVSLPLLPTCFILVSCLFFDLEERGDIFLPNVG
jgi:hypothetical protein